MIEHNRVLELNQTAEGWDVVTEKGTISCEHVVNAAGLWAKQVGRMAGSGTAGLSAGKHHYLITDTVHSEVAERSSSRCRSTVDLEGFTYMRQDQKGVLVGIYEIDHQHWAMDGAPWDYGIEELFQEQLDRIENELTLGFERYPSMPQNVGIKNWVNGAFTFSPDGNPLVGPVPGKRITGRPARRDGRLPAGRRRWQDAGRVDDPRRARGRCYGRWTSRAMAISRRTNEYIAQTTGQFYSRRFVMTYPNEQLPAGRPLKMAPAHDAMTEAGCTWGNSWDLEVPLYFAPQRVRGNADAEALERASTSWPRNAR